MFDVNLNKIELDTIHRLMDSDETGAYDELIDTIETLLEMRFNRGKQRGKAVFTDAVFDSVMYEMKQ